jgi:integrase/recombinase XerD
VLYDTGIRISELCGLRQGDFDRKRGILTVTGKGSKERRIALGNNCLRNLLYYLDKHRPDEEELADWGSAGEDHLFLSETRTPLTKNGVTLLFARLRKRAGITDKRISAHIHRHSFAVRYLCKRQEESEPSATVKLSHLLSNQPVRTMSPASVNSGESESSHLP